VRRRTRFRLTLAACGCVGVLATTSGIDSLAQVQTGPVIEPRSAHYESASVAKGAQAISEQHEKCSTRLVVNADALFQPHRWTLNYDALQTLDVLGPMITKAGNHPARILASTASSDSEAENLDVGQRRAITVRSWLLNHHFVDASAKAEAAKQHKTIAPQNSSQDTQAQKNGTIEVIIDTCH
jgi:outer membrane protein OmpA-like peptidoglycan-associated protein